MLGFERDIGIVFSISESLPVSLVHCDKEWLRLVVNLVSLNRESSGVEVVNVSNLGKGDELDNNINGSINRTKPDDTQDLSTETSNCLHQGDQESISGIGEVEGLVDNILHHTHALAHISFDLQVHKDRTNETGTHDCDISRKCHLETISKDQVHHDKDHDELEEKDEDCTMESIMHIFDIKFELMLDIIVKSLEGYSIGVATKTEFLLRFDHSFEVYLVIFYLNLIKLFLSRTAISI